MTSVVPDSDLAAGRRALLGEDPLTAQSLLQRAVAAEPANIEARYWLASARLTSGSPQAGASLDEARTLHALILARSAGVDLARCQSDAAYASDVATQFYARKFVAVSGVLHNLAISAGTQDPAALLNYGLALQHQGRPDEAGEMMRAAVRIAPGPAVHQFLLYPQLLCEDGERRHFVETRAWADAYVSGLPSAPHANPERRGRRLRIGYVAPRFAGSQLAQFVAPLLDHHDPRAVAVTLYPADAATETAWPSWIDVHPLGGLGDAQAAERIRADGIDVLSDCWGHTAGARLRVFGYRPAPVQVAWMNFVQTTGLSQMDYVLHADLPAGTSGPSPEMFTETIWRIGPVFSAFRAAAGRLAPTPTPALRGARFTFGSFNHPAKLSGVTLDAWGAILRGAPQSRLLLKYSYFADPVLQRVTQARFAARGVAPERITFAGHSLGEAYFRAFQEVDLMLDTWPAPGSTTTLDALSHGAPVLVKSGADTAGLYVRSILEACGLAELIADDAQDYIVRALDLAGDPQRLDAIRARTRPGFDGGACGDEAGFTRRIEAAFEAMFDAWRMRSVDRRAYG